MVSKRLRAARRLQALAEESEFFRIPANRTHSGKQIIPTVCRPLANGQAKLKRKIDGHIWSFKTKKVTTRRGISKTIKMYENWGIKFHDMVKAYPKMYKEL